MTWRRRADRPRLRSALGARQLRPSSARTRRGDRRRIDVHLPQDLGDDPALLLDEREQQVLRRDLRMSLAVGELLRAGDRFLCLLGVFLDVHDVVTMRLNLLRS